MTTTQIDTSAGPDDVAGGVAWAQKRYERVRALNEADLLSCDTVRYICSGETVTGTFTFCRSAGELVRAGHEQTESNNTYLTEWYYYDGPEMYYAELKRGTWRFVDSDLPTQDPSLLSETIDEVNEERRYYAGDQLITTGYRDYTLRSWIDTLAPGQAADSTSGVGVASGVGSERVLEVLESEAFVCE